MKIRLIAEGHTSFQRLFKRWGISFLIGEDILFDVFGDDAIFLKNIRKFGIDLTKIRHIVISHDDWDHTAGLRHVISINKDVSVTICPHTQTDIKKMIQSHEVRLIEASDLLSITKKVYTTGELRGSSRDRLIYEQSLVIKTEKGLAVVCGCAHPNVLDIVRFAKDKFRENVHYLIGGFHLKDNDDETNMKIIKNLQFAGVSQIVPLHCTGTGARRLIKKIFGGGCLRLKEGETLDL
ncbi:MAG: MBL fold metallo-hydrolase [Candidatus Aureabacteria bacterium]|nr:MBL fold metallo-hydrolase [Candidatus Auribacterota bacterium]